MRCHGELLTMRQARTLLDLSRSDLRALVEYGALMTVRRRARRRVVRRQLLALWSSGPGTDGGEAVGVREPRRPKPPAPASAIALPLPGSPRN